MKKEWFETWFDTPYYHILYKNRDFKEAEDFINVLINYLNPIHKAKILDLACGKGRHSYFLAQKDFVVTGVDLSTQSIAWAKANYHLPNLDFFEHDMRNSIANNQYDYIFNLFTSFGYFNNLNDNLHVLNAVKQNLKTDGILVIDFMNASKIIKELKHFECKEIDGIQFKITKSIENNKIIKQIDFNDNKKEFSYQEQVQILTLSDFEYLCAESNLKIVATYGNYKLNPFNEQDSPRLILFIKHNA